MARVQAGEAMFSQHSSIPEHPPIRPLLPRMSSGVRSRPRVQNVQDAARTVSGSPPSAVYL